MKKALSIISLTLVIMMLLSVSTLAAEPDEKLTALGQKTYYTGVSYTATEAMTIDGRLEEAEGWVCITPDFASKTATSLEYRFNSWKENSTVEALGEDMLVYASDFKYYVAQTETDIYFAIEDYAPYFEVDGEEGFTKACESLCRNFYNIRLGFDVEHYDRFVYIREANSLDQFNICGPEGHKNMKSLYGDIVSYAIARFAEDDTHLYDGNKNTTNQHYWTKPATKWTARLEVKLSKAMIKDMYVEQFGEGADANIDFTSMLVSASAAGSIANPTTSNEYSWTYPIYGTLLTKAEATENGLAERVIPDLVVFGKDPNAVEETEAPATEVADENTEVPATEAPISAGEPDIYDLPASSCAGAISVSALALVAALGTCTAFVAKKKED